MRWQNQQNDKRMKIECKQKHILCILFNRRKASIVTNYTYFTTCRTYISIRAAFFYSFSVEHIRIRAILPAREIQHLCGKRNDTIRKFAGGFIAATRV